MNQSISNDCHQKFEMVVQEWQLNDSEKKGLLRTFENHSLEQGPNVAQRRMNEVIMIHRILHYLFTNSEQANSWIRKSNKHFNDCSALSVMLENKDGLHEVIEYLNAQRN